MIILKYLGQKYILDNNLPGKVHVLSEKTFPTQEKEKGLANSSSAIKKITYSIKRMTATISERQITVINQQSHDKKRLKLRYKLLIVLQMTVKGDWLRTSETRTSTGDHTCICFEEQMELPWKKDLYNFFLKFKCRIIIRFELVRSSSEGCKCCLLALQCEALCVWSIPGRLCGPDWQTGQRWVTAYHKGKTSLCVGCNG